MVQRRHTCFERNNRWVFRVGWQITKQHATWTNHVQLCFWHIERGVRVRNMQCDLFTFQIGLLH
ncbi:Uncharacterised protein [Vibrio cholerae]|nr:Uncharacterised protein [Vibrio cholerae]